MLAACASGKAEGGRQACNIFATETATPLSVAQWPEAWPTGAVKLGVYTANTLTGNNFDPNAASGEVVRTGDTYMLTVRGLPSLPSFGTDPNGHLGTATVNGHNSGVVLALTAVDGHSYELSEGCLTQKGVAPKTVDSVTLPVRPKLLVPATQTGVPSMMPSILFPYATPSMPQVPRG